MPEFEIPGGFSEEVSRREGDAGRAWLAKLPGRVEYHLGEWSLTPDGATLIDPAAHGGHRETDLALLALFGAPHVDDIVAGYQEQRPLADGWRDRVKVHQLHCVLVHAVLFGGSYADQALAVART